MKMILMPLFIFVCALVLQAPVAEAASRGGGYGHGNGGDMCENRFKTVRDDLREWILDGGSDFLRLPAGITHEQYKQLMLEKINTAKVSCIDRKILIGGAEKTCRNFVKADGSLRIQCHRGLLMNTTESDQYVLVHHEYAGLAGFEVNNGDNSNYEISNQITGYLEDQIVKKLAVKPSAYENPFSSASCAGPQMTIQAARNLIPQTSEEREFPTFSIYTLERRCGESSPTCTEWTPIETQMPYREAGKGRNLVSVPAMGSIAFRRTNNGIAITLSTPLHESSGYGVTISCGEQGQGEITGRCTVRSLPDYQEIGEAYGTISAHCARLTYIENGFLGFPSVWGIRQLIFTAKY